MTLRSLQHRSGMTLIDVAIILAVGCLFIFLLLPPLANGDRRPRRSRCMANLKQMALGAVLWISDRESDLPWHVPRTRAGTLEFSASPEVFRHFAALSNEFSNPRILACPADKQRSPVTNFVQLANINVSYFVNLNASSNSAVSPLFGDRNIAGGTS